MNLVVLISGSGSNLQAIIDHCENGNIPGKIVGVISNRPNVKGLERAQKHGIPTATLDHKGFADRDTFDEALAEEIDALQPDLVILAGFMRILTPRFVEHYLGKMLNIHPSLLPKYPGLHTHKRALEAGDKEHGVTVHCVTPELDGGPAVIQATVPILDSDTEQTLAQRVLEQEHIIYPKAATWFCEGRLQLKDSKAFLDQEEITPQ